MIVNFRIYNIFACLTFHIVQFLVFFVHLTRAQNKTSLNCNFKASQSQFTQKKVHECLIEILRLSCFRL